MCSCVCVCVAQSILSLYASMGLNKGEQELLAADPSLTQHTQHSMPWRLAAEQVLHTGLDPYSVTGVVVDVGEGRWVVRAHTRTRARGTVICTYPYTHTHTHTHTGLDL